MFKFGGERVKPISRAPCSKTLFEHLRLKQSTRALFMRLIFLEWHRLSVSLAEYRHRLSLQSFNRNHTKRRKNPYRTGVEEWMSQRGIDFKGPITDVPLHLNGCNGLGYCMDFSFI